MRARSQSWLIRTRHMLRDERVRISLNSFDQELNPNSLYLLSYETHWTQNTSINSGTISLHLSRNVPLFCHSHDNFLPVVTVFLHKSLQVSLFLIQNHYFLIFILQKNHLFKNRIVSKFVFNSRSFERIRACSDVPSRSSPSNETSNGNERTWVIPGHALSRHL